MLGLGCRLRDVFGHQKPLYIVENLFLKVNSKLRVNRSTKKDKVWVDM